MTFDGSTCCTQRHDAPPRAAWSRNDRAAEQVASLRGDQVWEQLSQFSRWGWTLVAYGERAVPDRLVAYQRFGDHVDVLVIASQDRCAAYRAPIWPDQDPIAVDTVTWCYLGDLATVLGHLLALPPVDRTWPPYPLPAEVPLPDRSTRPVTIRPPQ